AIDFLKEYNPYNRNHKILIGLSGKIGSGKTTLAKYLCEQLGYEKKSFATKLREVAGLIGGFDPLESHTVQEKEMMVPGWNLNRGRMLQLVGTDMVRTFNDEAWIYALLNDYHENMDAWIIDDVRFKNEARAIKRLGGIVVRLEGDPGNVRKYSKRDVCH